ncbi:hypothetical protein Ddye_028134 [Dipteronia dyeriana]|uniref:3'-5' exonuclease domain-containing protein n=1 Tax=Dipteronia dyeriana TaxID=168575 RepID=A0AAD9TRC1_9ROSI|nr:hypothetical protein Ddye_028134 [Dipteronia dyeriana]
MIPINILSKLGTFEVEFEGCKIKVSVIDNAALIDRTIAELRSSLRKPVVGFDVKFGTDHHDQNNAEIAKLLILCVETHCLIIQLSNLVPVPDGLKDFLSDETICFVGKGMGNKVTSIHRSHGLSCVTGVEVSDFVARVLKKPNLIGAYNLTDLATEVGLVTVSKEAGCCEGSCQRTPNWSARIFTDAEIKSAIPEAILCYCIGLTLLGKLNL